MTTIRKRDKVTAPAAQRIKRLPVSPETGIVKRLIEVLTILEQTKVDRKRSQVKRFAYPDSRRCVEIGNTLIALKLSPDHLVTILIRMVNKAWQQAHK